MTVYPNALYAARFNTQPPEGGWIFILKFWLFHGLFQHTAA